MGSTKHDLFRSVPYWVVPYVLSDPYQNIEYLPCLSVVDCMQQVATPKQFKSLASKGSNDFTAICFSGNKQWATNLWVFIVAQKAVACSSLSWHEVNLQWSPLWSNIMSLNASDWVMCSTVSRKSCTLPRQRETQWMLHSDRCTDIIC